MELNQKGLFELALDIKKPLFIEEIEFNKEKGELHLYINFEKGSLHKCPNCNKKFVAYDTRKKTWRHLNFFQYKAYIHYRTPRIKCDNDGIHITNPPWAGKGDFTLLMDAMILEMAKHMAVSHIAEILDEHDTKIWRIIGKYVSTAQAIRNLSDVRKVGVDETASKRGHKYVTIFADLEEKKVIYATEGKNADTIKEFKEELPNHYAHPNNISEFSIDMSPAFIKGISENFSWASMTFDKFHVMKLINEAIDKTRREEQKENKGLKNTRFIWLKNSKKVGKDEKEYIEYLSRRNLKTARAYRIKLALEDIYREAEDKMEATKKLNKLYQWAIRSRIEAIKVFARTLKKHWLGLISYFDSRLTNGTLEGINSLVQAARTRAKGYRNIRNYITMIYLVAGKLSIDCKLYN